jgi:hypothetical protein
MLYVKWYNAANTYTLYADLSCWSKVQAFLEPYRLSPCTGDRIPYLFPSPITWLGREGNNWERKKESESIHLSPRMPGRFF